MAILWLFCGSYGSQEPAINNPLAITSHRSSVLASQVSEASQGDRMSGALRNSISVSQVSEADQGDRISGALRNDVSASQVSEASQEDMMTGALHHAPLRPSHPHPVTPLLLPGSRPHPPSSKFFFVILDLF